MVKQKRLSKMKTSEIMDALEREDLDSGWGELSDELNERSPFQYNLEVIEELREKVKALESDFSKHSHMDGKLVKDI